MELIKYLLSTIAVTIIGLTLNACDTPPSQSQPKLEKLPEVFNLTEQQWQNEIQQRFDTINGSGEPIKCISILMTAPYYLFDRQYMNLLQTLTEAGLLTEQIEIREIHQNRIVYIYNLTDEGKKYYRKWPNLMSSGFCFGKVIVKSVTKITPYSNYIEIEYQYVIDKLPPKLMPQNELKTGTVRFDYDEQTKKLYSKYGIGLIVKKY
ncbi:hypothetical protein [Gilliamella sp. WF3-4]|jgi:DNA-binding PadR family transcriptional regulator|uniref:hypothetical protein n=1 Tax=Gilliamella sp. WF3-4 TaxID=3120255 RepID=UPI00080EE6F5|nr:hypothetical protein [Gilliamella apicola]OCG19440.1 hypothetical protein A9G47_04130 [Gilliamella apicola]